MGATPTSCFVVGVVLTQEEREGGEGEAWMVVVRGRERSERQRDETRRGCVDLTSLLPPRPEWCG